VKVFRLPFLPLNGQTPIAKIFKIIFQTFD
jgi:hypothetical protein